MRDKKSNCRKTGFFQLEKSDKRFLLIVALLAVVARILYLVQLKNSVFFGNYVLDGHIIDLWAREIADKDFWGKDAFFRAPLYPYLVALIYKLFGNGPLPIIIFQNILGALTSLLTYFYARYILDRKTALIAGIITALWPTLIYFEGEMMITALIVFLSLGAVASLHYAIDKNDRKKYLGAGFVLGLAAIARPTVLVVLLIIPIYHIFSKDRDRYKKLFGLVLFYLIGLAIPILPVTIRNIAVAHDPVLISSQGGANFYIGNSRYADGISVAMPMVDVKYQVRNEDFIYAQSKLLAEQNLGRRLSDSEVSSYWFRQGLSEMADKPARALLLFMRKFMYFWHGQEIFNNKSPYVAGEYSSYMGLTIWKKIINFPSGVLFPLMLAGIYVQLFERKKITVPLLYIILFALGISAFFVCARFRQPVIPIAVIMAGYAVYRMFGNLKSDRRALIAPLLLFLAGLVVFNLGGDVESVRNKSQFENIRGTVYLQKQMYPRAIEHLARSLEIAPGNRSAIATLSYAYLKANRSAEAEKILLDGIGMFPESADLHFNLATLYYRQEKIDKARGLFWETLKLDPGMPDPYMALGMIYESENRPDSAIFIYRELLSHLPDFRPAKAKIEQLERSE